MRAPVSCGPYTLTHANLFGEYLASFKPRRCRSRPKDEEPVGLKQVSHAVDERGLGADDHEVHSFCLGEDKQLRGASLRDRSAVARGDAAVSRRA